MYQRFTKISVITDTPASEVGAGHRFRTQNAGSYYFVLNHSKRFRGGNTALHGGVKIVRRTRVVHLSKRVVHAFSRTTKPQKTMYHS